jgi:hypothetical protein
MCVYVCVCGWVCDSSIVWAVYKFFASQSQRKYKIIIFFFGEAKDSVIFSFLILLHKRVGFFGFGSTSIRSTIVTGQTKGLKVGCGGMGVWVVITF